MAGDWVAIRSSLISSPKLIRMVRLLDTDEFQSWAVPARNESVTTLCNAAHKGVTLALLVAVWSYAREHGKYDGDDLELEHLAIDDVDEIANGAPGFGRAMVAVGWLSESENGVTFPNFREFNPQTNAERQRRYRDKKKQRGDGSVTPPLQRQGNGVTPTQQDTTQQDTTERKETSTSNGSSSTSESDDDRFDEFWHLYPRKDDKKKARTAWRNLSKTKRDLAIQDCGTRYEHVERAFIPLPTTYLRGERWNDDPIPPKGGGPAPWDPSKVAEARKSLEEIS